MNDFDFAEPSPADLAAIEAEWPQVQADLDLLADPDVIDALVDGLAVAELAAMTGLDRRRLRRATAHTLRVVAEFAARPVTPHHICRDVYLLETGMTDDCQYGCKVMTCTKCGSQRVWHRDVYGCPLGRQAVA